MSRVLPPLLSPKSFWDFAADEFRPYVCSLFRKRVRKSSPKKPAGPKPEVTVRINAKGTPVISVRRDPKLISRAEFLALATQTKLPENLLFLALKKRKIGVSHV